MASCRWSITQTTTLHLQQRQQAIPKVKLNVIPLKVRMLKTNKSKFYEGPGIQSISLEQTFLKKRAKSVKKRNWLPVSKLSLSNFTKIKTPQIALKNFTKILIYLSIYFSLNSEAVTSKFSDKSKGINHILRNVVKWSDTL